MSSPNCPSSWAGNMSAGGCSRLSSGVPDDVASLERVYGCYASARLGTVSDVYSTSSESEEQLSTESR